MWNGIIQGVHWEPSDKCNSMCPMCPRYDRQGFENSALANTEWTLDNFIKAWPEEFTTNLIKILSCGNFGDPCACRDFSKIYQYIREINPRIILACNTNGSLRTPDWWYNLGSVMRKEQNRSNYCTFSLDGLEDTNHLYRRKTNFKKVIENAQAFIDAGGIAHWDFIVFKHNEHQVEEAKELAKKMGFENFNIKKTTRWANYNDNGQGYFPVFEKGEYLYDLEQPTDKAFRHHFEDATYFKNQDKQSMTVKQLRKVVGKNNVQNVMVDGEWKEIKLNSLNVACRSVKGTRKDAMLNEIYIGADGTVAPCCFLGSEPFHKEGYDENYMKILELDGGVDNFNMHKHNLFDILQRAAFQKYIPDTWNPGGKKISSSRVRPFKCGSCCGVEYNSLDFGELGDKIGSYFDKE